jgi:hypothetical protein
MPARARATQQRSHPIIRMGGVEGFTAPGNGQAYAAGARRAGVDQRALQGMGRTAAAKWGILQVARVRQA